MSTMDLDALVRRHARRRLPAAALRAAVDAARDRDPAEWRTVESALQAEFEASPRRARGLVAAFGDVAEMHRGREARGRAARLAGSYASYLGRNERALEHYAVADALLRGAARDGARLGAAAAELRLGRFESAAVLCRRVRRAARRRGDAVLAAAADLNEAVARHESGAPQRALALYARAAETFVETGPAALHAAALQNHANALVQLDRLDEARPLLRGAAETFDALGATHDAARCRMNAGGLLAACDRLGDADTELRAAEVALDAEGDRVESALARMDRADVLVRAGLAIEAVALLRAARPGLARGAPPAERERARHIEARALLASGRADDASARLRGAPPPGLAGAATARRELAGRVAAARGHYVAAGDALREAARGHQRAERPFAAARARTAAAWCAWRCDDPARARRDLRASARTPSDLPSLTWSRESVRFLVEADAGRRAPAGAALRAALVALEDVRDGLGADALRGAVLRGREAWFARAVRHVLDGPGGAPEALAMLERWRARALRDLLEGAERVAPSDDGLDALRARIHSLEERLEGHAGPEFLRGRGAVSPGRVARELASAERRLADLLRLRADGTAAAPDLAALRRGLAPGTLVLALFADDEGSLVFAVSGDEIHVHRSDTSAAFVADRVERLRFLLSQHELGSAFVGRHAARLARRIDGVLTQLGEVALGGVREAIASASRVVVVPHGAWHHVPFAALPLGDAPLVMGVDVALAPALGALERGPRRARGRALVVSSSDDAAPVIAGEGRAVAVALGARLLEGADAVLAALPTRGAPSCLHIAAHGRYRADAPALSGVRLADGWLRAAEMPGLALRGSTVVLSGCETGLSAVHAGDEVQGLVRGVLASGATELVASLWRVDDPATARLMVRFHEQRRTGSRADAALCAAQRSLIAEGAAPWFWAGFQTWTRRV